MARWPRLATARRALGYALGAGFTGGAATSVYLYKTDPSFERSVRFWWLSGPIVGHYLLERMRASDDDDREVRYKRLHAIHAPDARKVIEELRGMFVKVAQVMSVRPEVVPEEYRVEFRKLQDEAPPVQWDPIREVLERDLGAPVSQVFEKIEEAPLGAASIGQAHHVLWQGRQAVVKVQYPDAAVMMRADFRCLDILLWLVNKDALPMLRQVWEQFSTELDYAAEANNLRDLHEAFQASSEFSGRVVVPEPIPELTTGNVIGMGYLPGRKLELALRDRLEALGVEIGGQSIGDWLRSQQRNGLEHFGDEKSSSQSSEPPWLQRVAMKAARIIGLDRLLWLTGSLVDFRSAGSATIKTHELRSALHLLLDAHGYQLFFCPLFNADPHPGNILMLPDGKVGLIDFGQCKRLSFEEKVGIARLIKAVSQPKSPEADQEVAAAFEATGVRTKNGNRDFLALLPRLMFSRMQAEWFESGTLKEVLRQDKVLEIPIHMVMAYRTAILLRGLCLVLQENASVAEAWTPYAEKWLAENIVA